MRAPPSGLCRPASERACGVHRTPPPFRPRAAAVRIPGPLLFPFPLLWRVFSGSQRRATTIIKSCASVPPTRKKRRKKNTRGGNLKKIEKLEKSVSAVIATNEPRAAHEPVRRRTACTACSSRARVCCFRGRLALTQVREASGVGDVLGDVAVETPTMAAADKHRDTRVLRATRRSRMRQGAGCPGCAGCAGLGAYRCTGPEAQTHPLLSLCPVVDQSWRSD